MRCAGETPVDEVGLRSTPWPAVVVAGVFLGACATFYTLYAGVFAGIACLLALWLLVSAWLQTGNKTVPTARTRRLRLRLLGVYAARLGVMGVIAGAVALITWGPTCMPARRTGRPAAAPRALPT